jgi:hypothetical protein
MPGNGIEHTFCLRTADIDCSRNTHEPQRPCLLLFDQTAEFVLSLFGGKRG